MARRDSRAKILAGARTVFSSKGYRAATVADILAEAGVARATFYKYFDNKRQVFQELLAEFLYSLYENTANYVLEEPEDPAALADRMRQSLVIFYRIFLENRGLVVAYYREAFGSDTRLYAAWDDFDRRMTTLFARMLDRGVGSGLFREMDTTLVARALLMIFLQVPYRELVTSGRREIDISSIADEMVAFAMDGIMKHAAGVAPLKARDTAAWLESV